MYFYIYIEMPDSGNVASIKSKGFKRKGHWKGKGKGMAGKAYTMAKKALDSLRTGEEMKFCDVQNNAGAVSFAGQINALISVGQGSDINQRVGDKITLKHLNIKGTVAYNAAAGALGANQVCIMVICDTQNNGAAPAVTDVLSNSAVGTVCAPNAPSVMTNHGRFRIVKRELFTVGGAGPNMLTFDWFIRPRRHQQNVFFNGTLGTSYYKNAYYIIAITDVNVNDPYIGWFSRAAYVDV